MEETYKVYIKIDSNNYVIEIKSSMFLTDVSNWIGIGEGVGVEYQHANNYLSKMLIDENFCHNYIYENSVVRETTCEEKQAELVGFPVAEPTDKERISQLETLVLQLSGVI